MLYYIMVLLSIVARFDGDTGNKCKVKISGGVNIQKLKWIGYAIALDGVDKQVQDSVPLAVGGATNGQNNALGFQGSIIPNLLHISLDVLGTSQVHIANPRQKSGNAFIENSNPFSNGLPVVLSDKLNTIQMWGAGITFDLGKTIHNEIEVEVLKYDNNGKLIPMLTGTPFLVQADGTIDATGTAGVFDNIYGTTSIQSVVLYFDYDFSAYF